MSTWIRRFWPRLLQQLNLGAGAAGLGALLLTLAGLITSGPTRMGLIVAGAGVAFITIVVAVVKAWPPHFKHPADLEGKELEVADLDDIDPPVPAIGIVGTTEVGKTTLKSRLLLEEMQGPEVRTRRLTVRIGTVIHDPTTYLAIVDGSGTSYDQQFVVTERADILIVMYDHNDIETSDKPNETRWQQHTYFGEQLRDYLTNHHDKRRRIHLLLNKKDKWSRATPEEQKELRDWFGKEVEKWTTKYGNEVVTNAEHSNDSTQDMISLVNKIKMHWQRLQAAGAGAL